jgi:hypothetical protein
VTQQTSEALAKEALAYLRRAKEFAEFAGFDDMVEDVQEKIDSILAGLEAESLPVARLATSADNAADALGGLSESITNIPQGFKVAAARFQAMDPDKYTGPGSETSAGGGQSITMYVDRIEVSDVSDPRELVESIAEMGDRAARAETGLMVSRPTMYGK